MKLFDFPDAGGVMGPEDWSAAFGAANHHLAGPPAQICRPIDEDDVLNVTHVWAEGGDYSELSLCAVMRLHDGRWASIEAWCDTTGWGCQDGGEVSIADDYETIIYFGMGNEMRERLGITIAPYDPTKIRNNLLDIQTEVERLDGQSSEPVR